MAQPPEVVYVVDDDDGVREALSEQLQSMRFAVVTFESADRFLAHNRCDSAACLILDLQLPGMSGLELQQRLAQQVSLPIVFISGYANIPVTVRAMRGGAIEFLTKPLDPDALIAAIARAFTQDRAAREKDAALGVLRRRMSLLTPREREVLPYVVSGLLNKQTASILGITEVTLQVHRGQIMRKMEAPSFAHLVRMGTLLGIAHSSVLPYGPDLRQEPLGAHVAPP